MSETAEGVIARLVESCAADDRVAALFLGGSLARDEADKYSDIDLCVIVRDEAYGDVIAGRDTFVRAIGEPLFLEDFGNGNMAFVILVDGTELEFNYFAESDLDAIRSGPHRVLLDKDGILTNRAFPLPETDRAAQVEALREILLWFWHDAGHFTTAIGRGQLWWAAGQLEQLRGICVNLVRIQQGGELEDEPYWKLDREIATKSLGALRSTFVPMERDALLRAGGDILAFFRQRAPGVAAALDLPYPTELDRLVGGHLEQLIDAEGTDRWRPRT
jgi:predicted nucleotidyltransferase